MQMNIHIVTGTLSVIGGCLVIFSGLRRKSFLDVALGCCLVGAGLFGHLIDLDPGLTWLADLFGVSIILLALLKIRVPGQSGGVKRIA
jgi:hypothetical protein